MIELAIAIAQEAGAFLRKSVGKVIAIEEKMGQARNLVSEIDKGAEALIIKRIKERFPEHDILAEESGLRNTGNAYRWIIDPLDGTTNFLHAVPIFCVTVGIEHNGELIAGVTYDPNRDELFSVELGGGAFLGSQRLNVSSAATMIQSLMVTGFPYTIGENKDHALDHFGNFTMASQGIRRLGSAALDLAYVAAGRFDGYWEVSLNPWDMAAGVLMVREAGGMTTDFKGAPLSIYQKNVLATNGTIHPLCLEILGKKA